MKIYRLLIVLLTMCQICTAQIYESDTAKDAIMVISNDCYLYKSPQTIFNEEADTTLIKVPYSAVFVSESFHDNYFKVNYNGETGYIFCVHATVPKRIRNIRKEILKCYKPETITIPEKELNCPYISSFVNANQMYLNATNQGIFGRAIYNKCNFLCRLIVIINQN